MKVHCCNNEIVLEQLFLRWNISVFQRIFCWTQVNEKFEIKIQG